MKVNREQETETYGERSRTGRDMSSDTETEEVEERDAQGNDDTGP